MRRVENDKKAENILDWEPRSDHDSTDDENTDLITYKMPELYEQNIVEQHYSTAVE